MQNSPWVRSCILLLPILNLSGNYVTGTTPAPPGQKTDACNRIELTITTTPYYSLTHLTSMVPVRFSLPFSPPISRPSLIGATIGAHLISSVLVSNSFLSTDCASC